MASAVWGRRWTPQGGAEVVWGVNATTARLAEASLSALGVLVGGEGREGERIIRFQCLDFLRRVIV